MALLVQIRNYVTSVVFYCADYLDLLPPLCNPYYRGNIFYDEQKQAEEISVLDEGLEKVERINVERLF